MVFGNALEERIRQRAGLDAVAACIGMTQNEEVNLLFIRRVREEFKIPRLLLVLEGHITEKIIHASRGKILFGAKTDVDLWSLRLRRQTATESCWRCSRIEKLAVSEIIAIPKNLTNAFVLIAFKQGRKVAPVEDGITFEKGDELTLIIFNEKRDDVAAWLAAQGLDPIANGTVAKS